MKMTRERQILCAVAGLAAFGVMADRVLLSGTVTGPEEASAASDIAVVAGGVPTPTVTTAPATAVPNVSNVPVVSLAQRLSRVRPQVLVDTPNAFNTPASWEPAKAEAPMVVTQNGFSPEAFSRQHPLEAVTTKGHQRSAVIAGDVVTLGETRDGMTLTDIEDGSVIWSGHGVRVRVRLHPR